MSGTAPDHESGRAAFGPAIEATLAADPHRPGSVDAVLLDQQIALTPRNQPALYAPPASTPAYPRGSRPELERWVDEAVTGLIHPVQKATALTRFCTRIPRQFPTPERSTASGVHDGFGAYLCGGAEEDVVKNGSPLAAERARVLCVMAQIAGLPARLVFLARPDNAERHTVTEIFLDRWCVFDGFTGTFYPRPKSLFASAWDVQRQPAIVDSSAEHRRQRYADSAFFRCIGIAAYPVEGFTAYRYPRDPIPPDLAERLQQGLGA